MTILGANPVVDGDVSKAGTVSMVMMMMMIMIVPRRLFIPALQ
jgi:hypothetical protein